MKLHQASLFFAWAAFLMPHFVRAATDSVDLEFAKKLANKGEEFAIKNKLIVAISIVDAGGNLVFFQRHDGTQIGAIEVAILKAKSANAWRRPTKAFEDAVKGGKQGLISVPNVLAVEGGLPIVLNGKTVGGIGVSGGSSQQDGQVVEAIVGQKD